MKFYKVLRTVTVLYLLVYLQSCSCQRHENIRVLNVVNFGAIGNDNKDDTEAFQEALDYLDNSKITTLYVPKGTYLFSRTKVAGRAYCISLPSNCTIKGDGREKSILKLMPNQGNFTRLAYFDGKENLTLNNLSIDGNVSSQKKTKNKYNEHLAGLYINQSKNVIITNCQFLNTGGDGITIRGPKDKPTENVTIDNVKFNNNFRNGITLGSGFEFIKITNCEFGSKIAASPIDSEPEHGRCSNVEIKKNTFIGKIGGTIVTLGGHITVDGYSISQNTFNNTCIFMVKAKNALIEDNEFIIESTKRPVFSILYYNEDISIKNNNIRTNVKLIHLTATKGGTPRGVKFESNNVSSSYVDGESILLQGVSDISVRKNVFEFDGNPIQPFIKIKANRDMSNLTVKNNKISGFSGKFVTIYRNKKWQVKSVIIKDNLMDNKVLPAQIIPSNNYNE